MVTAANFFLKLEYREIMKFCLQQQLCIQEQSRDNQNKSEGENVGNEDLKIYYRNGSLR